MPLAPFSRTLRDVKGDRQVASAIRILEDAGVVRTLPAGAAPLRVRLLATPDRIKRELGEGRAGELNLLRVLWKVGGGEVVYRGAVLDWWDLADAAGGRTRAAELLDRLQDEGFVEWTAASGEGVWVLDRSTPPGRISIDWPALEEKRARETRKLQKMQGYAYAEDCRRGYVLRYFGDPAAMDECGACDNCIGGHGELTDRLGNVRLEAKKKGRGSDRDERRSRETRDVRPSAAVPTSSPVGAPRTERQDELFQRLRTMRRELARKADVAPFIVFTDATLDALATLVPETAEEAMRVPGIGPGRLEKYGHALFETIGAWIAEHGRPERDAAFDASSFRGAPKPPRDRSAGRTTDGGELLPPSAEESALYGKLKVLRSELAKAAGLPAYCIFPDRTLIELARRRPGTENEMLAVPGVGTAKLEKYGEAFLAALKGEG